MFHMNETSSLTILLGIASLFGAASTALKNIQRMAELRHLKIIYSKLIQFHHQLVQLKLNRLSQLPRQLGEVLDSQAHQIAARFILHLMFLPFNNSMSAGLPAVQYLFECLNDLNFETSLPS